MYSSTKLLANAVAVIAGVISTPTALSANMPDVSQTAPIALLVDVQSGQTLLSQNADRRFIPASITKVMSAYVAFELLATGKLSLDQKFAMSDKAAETWHRTGSSMFLEPGELVTVDLLLRGICAVSANDGSIVLAEGAAGSVDAWVTMMNASAQKLGMRNSHFATPNGWPDDGQTFTTARDLETLAKAMISAHPEFYATYFGQEGLRHNGFAQANHDPISGIMDGADGIKTGYTNQAGHGFLGSAARDGSRLIMVLGGIDTEHRRAAIAREFIEWGFAGFERRRLFYSGDHVATARVQNADQNSIPLISDQPINVVMPAGYTGNVILNVIYEGPLKTPIAQGERVAELEILVDGLPPARVPLNAGQSIERAGALQRISNAFQSWIS